MSAAPQRPALAARPASASQRWFVIGLVLFFVGLGVQYSHKVLASRSAFDRWRPQLLSLRDGTDVSQRFAYPNPPIMAVLLYPLAELPPLVGALSWFALKAALTLLALRWIFQMVADAGRPFPLWARVLTVVLSLRPIMGDLQHGNVNLFILFLVVAALAAYHRGRDLLAGVVLGLAIACKVTPALFLPYLVWKRAWRALAGSVLGLLLFLWPGFVPALCLGWDHNQHQLVSWYREMVHPFVVEGKVTSEHNNQSLPGIVFRLATHSPSFVAFPNNQWTPIRYDNLLSLSATQAQLVVKGCMLLFALLMIWCCRTPTQPRGGWRLAAEASLVLLGMLLFSERTWKHHCVTLVLPFAVLCYYLAACRPTLGMRRYLIGTLVTATVLFATTTSGVLGDEPGHRHPSLAALFSKKAQVYGAYVVGFLVLAAALIVVLRKKDTATAQQEVLPPTVDQAA